MKFPAAACRNQDESGLLFYGLVHNAIFFNLLENSTYFENIKVIMT